MKDFHTTGTFASLEALYETYSRRIYQHIYHLVRHHEDAEDLTQEVFVRAARALPQLQTARNLSGWLYRIATNIALDLLRQRKRVTWQTIDGMEWTLEAAETYDPQVRYNSTVELVYAALTAMPEHYRDALLLRATGYSISEIAQAQGRTPHALSSFYTRARARFEQHYQTHEHEGMST